jgi:branched-chain amino acid transport system ATP-binding protein
MLTLEINNLNVWYGGIHAVKGINIKIERGQIVTLVGANGAGKSSTIRSVAGLNRNVTGAIKYTNSLGITKLLGKSPPEERVKRGIALSPEGRRILPQLTVEENLHLGAWTRNDKYGIIRDIEHVYSFFPRLKERSWQKGGTLSGGEQQMLAVGRAMMSRPDLLMLDEPSLGLAPLLVKEVFEIIKEINNQGKTILLVEQNAQAAFQIAHYAYLLEVGKVVLEGTGAELAADKRVKEAYLGG